MRAQQNISIILASGFAASAVLLSSGAALGEELVMDQPMTVNGVESVCTGIGLEARNDPRWRDYSLRVELTGAAGQYLGDGRVNITGNAKSVDLQCDGPWLLVKLPAGSYQIKTDVADAGEKVMTARVPAAGQTRVVVNYPNAGGAVSPQATPGPG